MADRIPYPASLIDFHRMFPEEGHAVAYLFKLRYPDGRPCREDCEGPFTLYRGGRVIHCRACRKNISLTAGTIMHRSKQPLLVWLYGAFLVTTLTPGISGVQFQRQMGLSRYETAFQMLHKIRAATVNPGRELLKGAVEVDESYIGGVAAGGKGGRSTETKTLVLGAVEVNARAVAAGGRRAERVRFRVIPTASGTDLLKFVKEQVAQGTTIYTDGWKGYDGLAQAGYSHVPRIEGKSSNASKILPVIHREFSNLKTWLQGTHHGRVERRHLQAYLDELAFRHNRRFWKFSAFQRVLQIGVETQAPTYRDIYDADEHGRSVNAAGLPRGRDGGPG